jgi:hypothetical protein
MWYRTMLGFGVQLLQQFSGINAVRVSLFFLFLYFDFFVCFVAPSFPLVLGSFSIACYGKKDKRDKGCAYVEGTEQSEPLSLIR